jgi:putative phage-type endonuclease
MSTVTATGATLNRAEWLELRRGVLGASEAAAALGVSPYQTPVELWQRKVGLMNDQDESEAMRWGNLLEPVILAEYQHRTGRVVAATQEFRVHPGYPCLAATLDARCEDGRLVEVKTANAWAKEWGDEQTDEVPEPYLIQVAQQMAVTGAAVADVAVLIGGQRLKVYTVERNEGLIGRVVAGGLRFWGCVERREPPTWGRMDAEALAVLHPDCTGEAPWSPEDAEAVAEFVRQYEVDKGFVKLAEDRLDHLKGQILAAMGDARTGRLPDGRSVRRFRQEVAARQVNYESKAYVKHYFTIVKGER